MSVEGPAVGSILGFSEFRLTREFFPRDVDGRVTVVSSCAAMTRSSNGIGYTTPLLLLEFYTMLRKDLPVDTPCAAHAWSFASPSIGHDQTRTPEDLHCRSANHPASSENPCTPALDLPP